MQIFQMRASINWLQKMQVAKLLLKGNLKLSLEWKKDQLMNQSLGISIFQFFTWLIALFPEPLNIAFI